ncbi:MAG: DUF433 domain-containing protein [Anaerolineae bacterium]|nr:DUF433 domain-containing protein [Anaerolineae bacterium]
MCGGRPTFKYTRVEVSFILGRITAGYSVEAIVAIVAAYNNPHLNYDQPS